MKIWRDVTARMRDGCALLADVFLPDDVMPRVVVLERTPYGKERTDQSETAPGSEAPRPREEIAEAFTNRGYVLVVQDCRGTGASQGEFDKYVNEAQDGQDTLAWLADQPWCDGRIATMGHSYGAAAQLSTASLGSPHLVAMFLDCGGFYDAHRSGLRQGGAFDLKQATWAWTQARRRAQASGDAELQRALAAENLDHWLRRTPWRHGHSPISRLPMLEQTLVEGWCNEAFGPAWMRPGLYAKGALAQVARVPAMLVSSWYDTSVLATIDLWSALHALTGRAAPLVIGPWTHGDRHRPYSGELDFGDAANPQVGLGEDFLALRLAWFDQVLQAPATTPATPTVPAPASTPAVRYFLMGGGSARLRAADQRWDHGGRWRTAPSWPPPEATELCLLLTPEGDLVEQGASASRRNGTCSLLADPLRPVPTIGGAINSGAPVMAGGGFNQSAGTTTYAAEGTHGPLAARDDVLVFQTAPLEQPLTVTGQPRVHLFVSTDGPDADLAVKLVDVYPDDASGTPGPAFNVCDGILRLSHRDPALGPQPMTPDAIGEVEVLVYPTANVFATGHRLRLDIAGSNFPHFDINPNCDPLARTMDTARRARTTLHMGPATPSRLLLQVQP